MKAFEPPKVIWLQMYGGEKQSCELGDELHEVTWCADKIHDDDVRYVIDKRQLKKTRRKK